VDADSIGADRSIRSPKVPLGDRVARPVSTSCETSIKADPGVVAYTEAK
jgi:hypothetical protein